VHDPSWFSGDAGVPLMGPSVSEVKGLLNQYDLKARKSLGQHFLVDSGALNRVVAAAELTAGDVVVEIGPGLGVLTRELARVAGRVVAVEADEGLALALGEVLAGSGNVTIVNADALQVDPVALLAGQGRADAPPGYKVVANIPYYITSPILRHFLEAGHKPTLMVVMVQKEVGEAIVARPGDMSILSVSVQFYGKPAIAGRVPARSFYPAPKVDSVILSIDVYDRPPVTVPGAEAFFRVVRAGFSAPRKQLRNSLAQGLGISAEESAAALARAGIDPRRRAETLDLQEWARLCQERAGNG
jgi:16S rRNA (adenine1518-N6/adenine1519-N6)-dimethyltransferase